MTTDTRPHTEGTDPVFMQKPETNLDTDLEDIYPNKDTSNLENNKSEDGYNYGDWK